MSVATLHWTTVPPLQRAPTPLGATTVLATLGMVGVGKCARMWTNVLAKAMETTAILMPPATTPLDHLHARVMLDSLVMESLALVILFALCLLFYLKTTQSFLQLRCEWMYIGNWQLRHPSHLFQHHWLVYLHLQFELCWQWCCLCW